MLLDLFEVMQCQRDKFSLFKIFHRIDSGIELINTCSHKNQIVKNDFFRACTTTALTTTRSPFTQHKK